MTPDRPGPDPRRPDRPGSDPRRPDQPGLDARLVVDRGGFRLDMALTAAPGEVVALLGPNGAGKTTALRALAGLEPLTGGHLRLDGAALDRTPPESRPVGVVFQDYLLFPAPQRAGQRGVRPALPRRLQGGGPETGGRVAGPDGPGRPRRRPAPASLRGSGAARRPRPRPGDPGPDCCCSTSRSAALDARTRLEVRAGLRRHLAEFEAVAVLVTHDPLDAMVLADRLVVVEHGRVVQEGTPGDIARHPRTDYIARLVGLNLYRGRADGHTVRLDAGPSITTTEELRGPVFVAFPPGAVTLYGKRPAGASARNLWHWDRQPGDPRRPDPRRPHRRTPARRRPDHGRRGRTRPAPGTRSGPP
ncbi:ABC transporter ATP-binding protein OS=Streptomyces fumanus OX=67302 GN=GCM10018772_62600 PE=4 SV=1 [Streptomyces fumanus]